MVTVILIVFILGYAAIALEHVIRLNKAASALITGVLCWTIYMFYSADSHLVNEQLTGHVGEIAGILFFLLGAMTIVELIDAHDGFEVITSRITTTRKSHLLWLIGGLSFFLSALLDNLTATIVIVSLIRKLIRWRLLHPMPVAPGRLLVMLPPLCCGLAARSLLPKLLQTFFYRGWLVP
jgi:Na+/H+ antiporter NhaD/arsenite permease-like protein